MRPLVVLCLVIVAVAALITAILSSLSSGENDPDPTGFDRPAATTRIQPADDVEDELARPAPTRVADAPDTDREAVVASEENRRFDNWVEGTVTSPESEPLVGAKVELLRGSVGNDVRRLQAAFGSTGDQKPTRTGTTDENGFYRIKNVDPSSDYTLVVQHQDYRRHEIPYVRIPEQGGAQYDAELHPGIMLHGYVHDPNGSPVEGAELVLDSILSQAMLNPKLAAASDAITELTDEKGYYRFENVAPGNRNLTVRAAGYATKTRRNIVFRASQKTSVNLDFRLEDGLVVAGRVFTPELAGIPEASIRLIGYQPEQTMSAHAVTNANGDFLVEGLAPGTYMLQATAPGWGTESVRRVDAGDEDVRVQMTEQGRITGRVVDAYTKKPIPNFTASLVQHNEGTGAYGRSLQDRSFQNRADGTFELTGVEQGQYGILVNAAGYAPTYSDRIAVTQGLESKAGDIMMTHGGILVGRVVDESGEPIQGAVVATQDNNYVKNPLTDIFGVSTPRRTTARAARTDKKGEFRLELLAAELYQLQVTHSRFPERIVNNVRVQTGETVTVQDIRMERGSAIRGTVYDEAGQPLPGAEVQMTSTNSTQLRSFKERCGPDGRFVIDNVPQGTYKLAATRTTAHDDGNPFKLIVDMKNSEVLMSVAKGQDYSQDLYLGSS